MTLAVSVAGQTTSQPQSLLSTAHVEELSPGARIAIIPRYETDFPDFKLRTPPRSIALDGFVSGPTEIDRGSGHYNFNHHSGVIRWVTLCTSAQVHQSLKVGLLEHLLADDAPDFSVFNNDADPDSSWASFQILYATSGLSNPSPMLNRLQSIVSDLDVSGAMHGPKTYSNLFRQSAWIFEPYYRALKKDYYDLDGAGLLSVLTDQFQRMREYLTGQGHSAKKLDTRVDSLHEGEGWSFIRESGPFSRLKALQKRMVDLLVILKSESSAGYRYSAVASSHLSRVSTIRLATFLNRVEGAIAQGATASDLLAPELVEQLFGPGDQTGPWGGGDLIIGSLRKDGSRISPAVMPAVIELFLRMRKA